MGISGQAGFKSRYGCPAEGIHMMKVCGCTLVAFSTDGDCVCAGLTWKNVRCDTVGRSLCCPRLLNPSVKTRLCVVTGGGRVVSAPGCVAMPRFSGLNMLMGCPYELLAHVEWVAVIA